MSSRSLCTVLTLLAVCFALTMTGCSWTKPKPQPMPPVAPPVATPEAMPPSAPPEGPRPGSTVEFPEGTVNDVHFDYDKSDIKKDQLAVLDKDLTYFKEHPDNKIMIEGHCDERGTEEYNFALGQRRAAAVQQYLLKNGIAADRLATISKGKDAPLDPAKNEKAYAKNRRTHFLRMY